MIVLGELPLQFSPWNVSAQGSLPAVRFSHPVPSIHVCVPIVLSNSALMAARCAGATGATDDDPTRTIQIHNTTMYNIMGAGPAVDALATVLRRERDSPTGTPAMARHGNFYLSCPLCPTPQI